jgi:hypothetical protein
MDKLAEAHARGDSDDDESGIQIEDDFDSKDNSKQKGLEISKPETLLAPEIQYDVG